MYGKAEFQSPKNFNFPDRLQEIESHILAENTNSAYETDLRLYSEFLNGSTPNEANLKEYLVFLSQNHKFSTISRKFTAINRHYKIAGPEFRKLLTGIRNTLFDEGQYLKQAKALPQNRLYELIEIVKNSDVSQNIKFRNIALLLTLYHTANRVSELISLRIQDLKFSDKGCLLYIRKSKTDRLKQGFWKSLYYHNDSDYCPVKALSDWLNVLGKSEGVLFPSVNKFGKISDTGLHRQDVYDFIKKLDKNYSNHSFRAGYITTCAEKGISPLLIIAQTQHKNYNMVLRYTRSVDAFTGNSSEFV
jgi:site-specific recombinase XerD